MDCIEERYASFFLGDASSQCNHLDMKTKMQKNTVTEENKIIRILDNQIAHNARESALIVLNFDRKRGPGLEHSLVIGKLLYEIRSMGGSTVARNHYIREHAKEVLDIPSCHRSNLLWLYEQDTYSRVELLSLLQVESLSDFYSENATVIRREHRKAAAKGLPK